MKMNLANGGTNSLMELVPKEAREIVKLVAMSFCLELVRAITEACTALELVQIEPISPNVIEEAMTTLIGRAVTLIKTATGLSILMRVKFWSIDT